MKITIERPEGYPIPDWHDCCKHVIHPIVENDADAMKGDLRRVMARFIKHKCLWQSIRIQDNILVFDEQGRYSDALANTPRYYIHVTLMTENVYIELSTHKTHSKHVSIDDLLPEIYAELVRVVMEIRVCFP